MNSAKIGTSERLQRVAQLLSDGKEHSTRDIVVGADVCAVNSVIAELRDNGHIIVCSRRDGNFYYRQLSAPRMAS